MYLTPERIITSLPVFEKGVSWHFLSNSDRVCLIPDEDCSLFTGVCVLTP